MDMTAEIMLDLSNYAFNAHISIWTITTVRNMRRPQIVFKGKKNSVQSMIISATSLGFLLSQFLFGQDYLQFMLIILFILL